MKFVFVTDDAVYAIAYQNFKGLRSNIANKVDVTGEPDGTMMTVSKISPIRKKVSKKN